MQEPKEGIDGPILRSAPLESQEKEVEPNVGPQPSPELVRCTSRHSESLIS